MSRESEQAQDRAQQEARRNAHFEQAKKAEQDKLSREKFEKEQTKIAEEAEKVRDKARNNRSWPLHEKIRLEYIAASKRKQKAIEELVAADEAQMQVSHALYHSAPVTDGTIFDDSPLSPKWSLGWMQLNLFKISERRFRWVTRTIVSPVEIKTFLEQATLAADWCLRFKGSEKKPDISKEDENIF